jgi:hypothetical protein
VAVLLAERHQVDLGRAAVLLGGAHVTAQLLRGAGWVVVTLRAWAAEPDLAGLMREAVRAQRE